jgi:hypothetical protein
VKILRKWRERRRRRLADIDPAEAERLRDLTSPVKAKWGYYPK